MADIYAAERARRTAAIVRAEREIEAVAAEQYAKFLAAVAAEVLRDKPPVVAAPQDPDNPTQNQDQLNMLWLVLAAVITAKIAETFANRFLGTGAMRSRLAEAQRKFTDGITSRLRGVPDELFATLKRIADDPNLSAAEKRRAFESERLPGRQHYKERLSAVASRIGRSTGTAAFNGGDAEGFREVAEERSVDG